MAERRDRMIPLDLTTISVRDSGSKLKLLTLQLFVNLLHFFSHLVPVKIFNQSIHTGSDVLPGGITYYRTVVG
jgi:hypothetical protein